MTAAVSSRTGYMICTDHLGLQLALKFILQAFASDIY